MRKLVLIYLLVVFAVPFQAYGSNLLEKCQRAFVAVTMSKHSIQKNFNRVMETDFNVTMYRYLMFDLNRRKRKLLPEFRGYETSPNRFKSDPRAMKLLRRAAKEAAIDGFVFSYEHTDVEDGEVEGKILDYFFDYITRSKN